MPPTRASATDIRRPVISPRPPPPSPPLLFSFALPQPPAVTSSNPNTPTRPYKANTIVLLLGALGAISTVSAIPQSQSSITKVCHANANRCKGHVDKAFQACTCQSWARKGGGNCREGCVKDFTANPQTYRTAAKVCEDYCHQKDTCDDYPTDC
ncbi:hypothetical protein CF336_g9412 [Tilletia laevis]|nr:hypothetical protein CF336_g9412 [Tilletia laevis]KAE8180355.1 hypothetical protein CF328_g9190 [Tilletia controversa]